MLNPYNPAIPQYRPLNQNINNQTHQQLNPDRTKAIAKTVGIYGSTFVVATAVAVGLSLVKKLTTPIIFLAGGIVSIPIGFTINEGAKIFFPELNNPKQ